jgi:hypothetical protein
MMGITAVVAITVYAGSLAMTIMSLPYSYNFNRVLAERGHSPVSATRP